MGILNKLFGFRWSLYIVKNETQLSYAMHENSVIRITGYVMGYFANGGKPAKPWSLYLNFNHKHQSIKLESEHFTEDGESVTPLLIQQIEKIDPDWRRKGSEPLFEEAVTKKKIKIQESSSEYVQALLNNSPRELTFFQVMDEIFYTERKISEPTPTAFDSLAAICKFIAISKINPDFYANHHHSIELACSFIRMLANQHPEVDKALRESLPLKLSEGAQLIEQAIISASLSEEKIEWLDRQMTATLQVLLQVVFDSELPEWLSDSKWAIEQGLTEQQA